MRFLLLLPRNAVRLANFTVPAFEGLYALCPPDLSPRASGGEQKEKGNYTRSVCIHTLPSLLCTTRASPMYFSLQYTQVHSSIFPCCAYRLCFCQVPPELPAHGGTPGPCSTSLQQWGTLRCILLRASTSRGSRDQPVEPAHHCTQVGARELQADGSCSCIKQY